MQRYEFFVSNSMPTPAGKAIRSHAVKRGPRTAHSSGVAAEPPNDSAGLSACTELRHLLQKQIQTGNACQGGRQERGLRASDEISGIGGHCIQAASQRA